MFSSVKSFITGLADSITEKVKQAFRYVANIFKTKEPPPVPKQETACTCHDYKGSVKTDNLINIEDMIFMDQSQTSAFDKLRCVFNNTIYYPYDVVVKGYDLFIRDNRDAEYYKNYKAPEHVDIDMILGDI